MAQIVDRTTNYKQQKPRRKPPRSVGCFLGCFGGPSRGSPENEQPLAEGESKGIKKTRTKWFSWSKLKKKNSTTRTVPIDGTADEKVHPKKGGIFLTKSNRKLHKDQTPAPATEKIVNDEANKTKCDKVQEIILEDSKSMKHDLDSMTKPTCRKRLSTIGKCVSLKSINNPTSPEDKSKIGRGELALSHSASMPPSIKKKTGNVNGGDFKVKKEEKTSQREAADPRKFDQFVGMSMIMITLIIMVFWGRICAILCISAWFYFYPLVRAKNEPKVDQKNGSKSGDQPHLNSQEYKKKVVFEGFLERNHRIH